LPFSENDNTITVGARLAIAEWDEVFAAMAEREITSLHAGSAMTDAALELLAKSDVARGLEELDISGWEGEITDRGLDILSRLPALRRFNLGWQQHVSDAGMANLASCEHIESVNLMGTPTGDGAIQALAGKRGLRHFHTGRLVSDAGLPLLHNLPVFKTWQDGEIRYDLMSFSPEPNHLLLDGCFTDESIAGLRGLAGLFGLGFFRHCSSMSPAALRGLAELPNLGFLGCEGRLCTDDAMGYIAALPRLRMLVGQGAVAGDDGFTALGRSETLEYFWGRECPNLTGRGLIALLRMPALRGLGVSFKKVDEASLALLPDFPVLCELMPMDVSDAGFRHVGRCEGLESLWCMYCRETGDVATEHIAGLRLKYYYAGGTRITDRSLEVLARMESLERLEFWNCTGITNEGLAQLTRLPRLREIRVDGVRLEARLDADDQGQCHEAGE